MGASSWYYKDILQALLIGLAVQIAISVVCILCASLWASIKERMSRPAAGPMAERDLEMGTVNGGEGATILEIIDHPRGSNSAANRGVPGDGDAHHEGKLERTEEDMAALQNYGAVVPGDRASCAPQAHNKIPTIIDHLPNSQLETVTEDVTTRASVVPAVVVDVSHTQQQVAGFNSIKAPVEQSVDDGHGMTGSSSSSSSSDEVVADSAPASR